jgi:hypothetical protein
MELQLYDTLNNVTEAITRIIKQLYGVRDYVSNGT